MAIIEDFENIATEIIKEAAAYSGATEENPGMSAAIRQLRTVASALLNALDSALAAQRRGPFMPPMPPTPDVASIPAAPMASRLTAPAPKVN